jgi:crotonobetainyl-CoA:carnitine CoA-transferase CaiB-like acyl-CoA transferase
MQIVGNPLKFSETPLEYKQAPPLLGEHTVEVLRNVLGIGDAEIQRLTKQGVVTP